MNAITYKEVFPLIKENKMWLGESIHSGDREFGVPKEYPLNAAGWRIDEDGNHFIRVKGVRWFTNLEHGRRHQPLQLMTMADNIKFSRHKELRGKKYLKYDNYDAIEVPFTDAIPNDYEGVMGVPISFLDKYCPEQFEILGMCENEDLYSLKTRVYNREECQKAYQLKFGKKGSYDLNASGMQQYFTGLDATIQKKILETPLTIYVCEGEEHEIKEWFKTINIAGIPLNEQELLNAIYSGPFVTAAKAEFSNSANAKMQKWKSYVKGDERRQQILKTALEWVSEGNIDGYMSTHRKDVGIEELKTYFETVIDWASGTFEGIEDEMCGLEWGRLYKTYHENPYNKLKVWTRVKELYEDGFVKNRRGIFEFILGGEKKIRSFLMFAFSSQRRQRSSMQSRQRWQKRKASPTVLYALLVIQQTPSGYGNSPKWTPTMLRHGRKVVQPISQTVKCYAKPTTAPKETNEALQNYLKSLLDVFTFSSNSSRYHLG